MRRMHQATSKSQFTAPSIAGNLFTSSFSRLGACEPALSNGRRQSQSLPAQRAAEWPELMLFPGCCFVDLATDVGSIIWGRRRDMRAVLAFPISYTLLPVTVAVDGTCRLCPLAINSPGFPRSSGRCQHQLITHHIQQLIQERFVTFQPHFRTQKVSIQRIFPNNITSITRMQYTTAIVLAVAGLAAAQSTTSSAATTSASADSQSGCGTAIDAYG